jgi:hypothetical protein
MEEPDLAEMEAEVVLVTESTEPEPEIAPEGTSTSTTEHVDSGIAIAIAEIAEIVKDKEPEPEAAFVLEVEKIPSDSPPEPEPAVSLKLELEPLKLEPLPGRLPAVQLIDDLTPVNENESQCQFTRVQQILTDEEDQSSLADVWCDARDEIASDESSLRAVSALSSGSVEEIASDILSQVLSEASERYGTCHTSLSRSETADLEAADLTPDQEALPALETDSPEISESEPRTTTNELDLDVDVDVGLGSEISEHCPVSESNGEGLPVQVVGDTEEISTSEAADADADVEETAKAVSQVTLTETPLPSQNTVELISDDGTDTEPPSPERVNPGSGRRGSLLSSRGLSVCEEDNVIVDYLVDVKDGVMST